MSAMLANNTIDRLNQIYKNIIKMEKKFANYQK